MTVDASGDSTTSSHRWLLAGDLRPRRRRGGPTRRGPRGARAQRCGQDVPAPVPGRARAADARGRFGSATTYSRTRRAASAVPPERRPVGVVFQDYLLFPHLSAPRQRGVRPAVAGAASGGVPAYGPALARADRPGRAAPTASRPSSRAARRSGSPWPGRSPPGRACCCSTSRCRRSTPAPAGEVRTDLREHLTVLRRPDPGRHARRRRGDGAGRLAARPRGRPGRAAGDARRGGATSGDDRTSPGCSASTSGPATRAAARWRCAAAATWWSRTPR